MQDRYDELRQQTISNPYTGDRMCLEYADVIQRLIYNAGAATSSTLHGVQPEPRGALDSD